MHHNTLVIFLLSWLAVFITTSLVAATAPAAHSVIRSQTAWHSAWVEILFLFTRGILTCPHSLTGAISCQKKNSLKIFDLIHYLVNEAVLLPESKVSGDQSNHLTDPSQCVTNPASATSAFSLAPANTSWYLRHPKFQWPFFVMPTCQN